MAFRHVIVLFLTVVLFHFIKGETDSEKSNELHIVLRSRAELVCNLAGSNADKKWQRTPFNQEVLQTITVGSNVVNTYSDKFSLDTKTDDRYNLIITEVNKDDAGTYFCKKTNNVNKIELSVLDSAPVCKSNIDHNDLVAENSCGIQPDNFSLSCEVKFYGKVSPKLTWREIDDQTNIFANSSNIITNSIEVKAKWNQFVFKCEIRSSNLSCFFVSPKPIYIFNTRLNTTIQHPQTVTCSANSSQICEYKWTRKGEGVSDKSTLPLTSDSESGEYLCEAVCKIREQSCSVHPILVNYKLLVSYSFDNLVSRIVTAVVVTVLILGIIVGITFCVWRWKRKKTKEIFSQLSCGREIKIKTKTPGRIKGVTVLKNKIYIVQLGSPTIRVYDIKTGEWLVSNIVIAGLNEARDLVSCETKNSLYVSDCVNDVVYKIMMTQSTTSIWRVETRPEGLSVVQNDKHNILVACPKEAIIKEFASINGECVRKIKLNEDLKFLSHAVWRTDDTFLISYGSEENPDGKSSVCVVSSEGDCIENKMYTGQDQKPEDGVTLVWPTRSAETKSGNILVADFRLGKLLLLNSNFQFEKIVINLGEYTLSRMCFDEENMRIYITENKEESCIRVYKLNLNANEQSRSKQSAQPLLPQSKTMKYSLSAK